MTRIKICGVSREADIKAVNIVLPDYIGFVFAQSRRQVSPEQALQLRSLLDGRIISVGVFVDGDAEQILSLYERGVIQMAQLHGQNVADCLTRIKGYARDLPVIAAIPVDDGQALPWPLPQGADHLLFDNHNPGSGYAFDWNRLSSLRGLIQGSSFIAGGINEDNIGKALALQPFCVDVSSGVETNGHKDPEKIRSLVQQVRETLLSEGRAS